MNILKKDLSIKHLLSAYLPPIVWAGTIFLFSSQTTLPGFEQSLHDFFLKKTAHIVVYFGLYFLVFRAIFMTLQTKYQKTLFFLPIFICLLYGISDELHQSFVPGRYATIRDIGYDMLGVTIAVLKKYEYI